MKCKISFVTIAISLLLICCGLLLNCSLSQPTKDNNSSEIKTMDVTGEVQKGTKQGFVSIGIKDPAGEIAVLEFSEQSAKRVKPILDGYSYGTVGCMNVYEVDSWEGISKIMRASSKELEILVWNNYSEISKLKSRIETLEKKQSENTKIKDIIKEKNQ